MAAKRKPMLPDDLDLDAMAANPGGAAPHPFLHQQSAAAASVALPPTARLGLKERAVNMSIYLLPADHRRLRRLAVDRDTSIQSLVLDGIDAVLGRHGQPPVTRWETRRKPR